MHKLLWKQITKEKKNHIYRKLFASVATLFSHFLHSSPPPSLFFGDYSTMHLPVETAAMTQIQPCGVMIG